MQIGSLNSQSLFVRLLTGLGMLSATFLVFGLVKSYNDTETIIAENEQEILEQGRTIVPRRFRVNEQLLTIAASQLLLNDGLIRAFFERDRDTLASEALEAFQGLSASHVDLLHFHLPDNVTFFRAHRPDRFGDDLSAIRPMISAVNAERTPAAGWEGGRHGLALRQIEPVYYDGEYAGALEVGMFLDERILSIWKNAVLGDWYLCRSDEGSITQVAGTTDAGCSLALSPAERQTLHEPGAHVHAANDLLIQMFPLVDYFGHSDFFVKRIVDASPIRQVAARQRTSSMALGLLVLTVASLMFAYLIRRVLKPLDDLVSHAQTIAAGNFDYPISAKRPDEIGELSNALENMRRALKEKTAELKSRSVLFETLAETASEWILWQGPNGEVIYSSPSCQRIIGRTSSELEADPSILMEVVHPEDRASWKRHFQDIPHSRGFVKQQFRILGKEQDVRWIQCRTSSVFDGDGKLLGLRSSITDITSQKESEERLRHLSLVDPLTGAYNRAFLGQIIESYTEQEKLPVTVVAADVDGLKATNDNFGHAAGDELLKAAAQIMGACLRKADALARIGGDEFVILMPETQQKDAEVVLSRIQAAIDEFNIDRQSAPLSISFGVACNEGQAETLERTLERADLLMYQHKRRKKRRT
ncbi:MAG: diguanylate cyclase [Wenzhouxiangella sp.]|jgi:diguanylate cyclase (GGDEF)-like protein/PAS domain S-box-containing protein|nr:diguanylate cyclase [Wenzhouxiangella sp.]